jgi:hypothetical protein
MFIVQFGCSVDIIFTKTRKCAARIVFCGIYESLPTVEPDRDGCLLCHFHATAITVPKTIDVLREKFDYRPR